MRENALDRVGRALNLIPFLSNNPGLSVVQIADRFHSTPAQISKDLSLLHMCGLPGYTHLELLNINFDDPEAIFVADAQVLDQPRSLTQVEALTLVLGLQLLAELSGGVEDRDAITSLQKRIGERIEKQLSEQITIADAVEESPHIAVITKAISNEQFLTIEYNSATSDSITARKIFPLSISYQNGIGYLQAIATSEEEVRTFRIDRIVQMNLGESAPGYADTLNVHQSNGAAELEIEMGPDGIFFIEKHNEIVTSFEELGEGYRIKLHAAAGEWILRTLLSWPSPIKVLTPSNLAQLLHDRIAGALANYE